MAPPSVGLLHPGEMGSAIGAALRERGTPVLWASESRSRETAGRAAEAGLEDVGTLAELFRRSDVIVSVCPPHAALDVAASAASFDGLYVDANAVAPATARAIADTVVGPCVDGGIVGPPPRAAGTTRLYLSGAEAPRVAELFASTPVDPRVVSAEVGSASALKLAYAAWTKGTAALLLAIGAFAESEGVDGALLEEWRMSLPELPEHLAGATRSARAKGWRWVGEMEETAAAFEAAGLPEGFHRAAADVFGTLSKEGEHVWPRGVPS